MGAQLLIRSARGVDLTEAEKIFLEHARLALAQVEAGRQARATTSLAQSLHHQGRTSDARQLLSATYDRFTERFSTRDLTGAKTLLGELRYPPDQIQPKSGPTMSKTPPDEHKRIVLEGFGALFYKYD